MPTQDKKLLKKLNNTKDVNNSNVLTTVLFWWI